jgi:hypothetical protein
MLSTYVFANSDQRQDAETVLSRHGYHAWCGDIGQQHRVLVVDHPYAYLPRVNDLLRKACPKMPLPGLGASSDTSPPSRELDALELRRLGEGRCQLPGQDTRGGSSALVSL